jgi:tRNA(His) 5'-end guanylyltransferase
MSSLPERMAEYEQQFDYSIIRRVPLIVRVDGKNFSKYTRSIKTKKPFDEELSKAMATASQLTANKIDGCIFCFQQSDEASFVLINDQSLETTPWLGNRIQKVVSIVSSMFSVHFNSMMEEPAYFDARIFALPNMTEVANYLQYRQNDATRNSIQLAARYEVAKKLGKNTTLNKIQGLNSKQQQELLFQEAGINWNDYPIKFKRGIGIYKETYEKEIDGNKVIRSSWKIDESIPAFNSDKEFLAKILKRDIG